MAMTLSEITDIARRADIRLQPGEDNAYLWAHWTTDLFTSPDHDAKLIELHILLAEDGEFLHVMASRLYDLKDCPHRSSVFEALLTIAYITKSMSYEYDPEDGELRATIEMPLEDGRLTPDQFSDICNLLVCTVDAYDSVVRHAMRTGTVDMNLEGKPLPDADKQRINARIRKAAPLKGARKSASRAGKGKG